MGDARRFDVFATAISRRWPDRSLRIADVAGGKGGLRAALYRLGYESVVTIDKRSRKAHRPYYRYGLLTAETPCDFDLIVGMHPDEATDVLMDYAITHRLPYAVVPCCERPVAWRWDGGDWIRHLARQSERRGRLPEFQGLPMTGRNVMLCA